MKKILLVIVIIVLLCPLSVQASSGVPVTQEDEELTDWQKFKIRNGLYSPFETPIYKYTPTPKPSNDQEADSAWFEKFEEWLDERGIYITVPLIYLSLHIINGISKKNLTKNLGYLTILKYEHSEGFRIPEGNLYYNLGVAVKNTVLISQRILKYSSIFISIVAIIVWFFLTSRDILSILAILLCVVAVNIFHVESLKSSIEDWKMNMDADETVLFDKERGL